MNYLKSLFYNFLIVFFSNYLLPGIDIVHQSKITQIGGDLIFAIILGLINSLIYPILNVLDHQVNIMRIAIASLSISILSYVVLKFAPLGIEIRSIEGFFLPVIVVAIGSFLINFFEMRKGHSGKPPEMPT